MHKNCATKLSFNSGHLFVCVCKWHWSPMDRSDLPLQMVIIENRSPPRVSLLNERCSLGSATGGVLKNTLFILFTVCQAVNFALQPFANRAVQGAPTMVKCPGNCVRRSLAGGEEESLLIGEIIVQESTNLERIWLRSEASLMFLISCLTDQTRPKRFTANRSEGS